MNMIDYSTRYSHRLFTLIEIEMEETNLTVYVLSSVIDCFIIRRDAKISSLYHLVIFYPSLIYNWAICCCHHGRRHAEYLLMTGLVIEQKNETVLQ